MLVFPGMDMGICYVPEVKFQFVEYVVSVQQIPVPSCNGIYRSVYFCATIM